LSLGIWRAWADFDLSKPALLAVVAVPLSLMGLAVLYRKMERRGVAPGDKALAATR